MPGLDTRPIREILHWPGTVSDHVDVRNGPVKFWRPGTIWKVEYVWRDAAPSTDATVETFLDSTSTATFTHTVAAASGDEHVETVSQAYTDEHIVGVVTADGGGVGLTIYYYLR